MVAPSVAAGDGRSRRRGPQARPPRLPSARTTEFRFQGCHLRAAPSSAVCPPPGCRARVADVRQLLADVRQLLADVRQLLAFAAMRTTSRIALLLVVLLAACDRNIEPYDPNEKVEKPDLSKIFPEGAERSGDAQAMRGAMPEAAAPVAPAPRGGGEPLTGTIRLAADLEGRVPAGAVLF